MCLIILSSNKFVSNNRCALTLCQSGSNMFDYCLHLSTTENDSNNALHVLFRPLRKSLAQS